MANSLNMELEGKTVVLKASSLNPAYYALKQRLFHVSGGFGAYADTIGTALVGTWLVDRVQGTMRGYDVERLATPADFAETGLTDPDAVVES